MIKVVNTYNHKEHYIENEYREFTQKNIDEILDNLYVKLSNN
jgi:hypothetical protein